MVRMSVDPSQIAIWCAHLQILPNGLQHTPAPTQRKRSLARCEREVNAGGVRVATIARTEGADPDATTAPARRFARWRAMVDTSNLDRFITIPGW